MKIVIVTPYDSSNYGAYLQAYCLKHQLEKMNHKILHIPTRDAEYVRNLYYRDKPVSKREKLMPWKFKAKKQFGMRKMKLFQLDQKVFHVVDPEQVDADLYILGSDEIWNIMQPAFRRTVFWGVGMSPAISYASSIGRSNIDSFEKYPELINAVRKLNKVLVRDERTRQFVKKYTGEDVPIVCDPTMLVPVEEYGREFHDSYIEKNDCLLIYAYNLEKKAQKSIKAYARQNKMKVVSCCFQHDWCDYQCECSPLQFSSLIRQCQAVITTTFHGTIFSILNHANFVSIPVSPKTDQLLAQVGLENRLLPKEQLSASSIGKILNGESIDYAIIEQTIRTLRAISVDALQRAIKTACEGSKLFDYQICPSDDCTGCFACMNKCKKNAISCIIDVMGRTLPQINPNLCVKCGLCKKVCPQQNAVELHEPLACYAAQRPNENIRKKSASGGIGAAITERFIEAGGTVFGAVMQQGGKVEHISARDLKTAERFRKSKYVQSYIGMSYRDVLENLKAGKNVLFTGTPCQIAGLKSFLGKPYANLYCIDIICHGVPPMKYLEQHLNAVTGGEQVDFVTFRGGERDFVLNIISGNRNIYSKDMIHDIYYHSFLKCLNFRENCYKCIYATQKRCSDITIGDFRKINRQKLKTPQRDCISVILIHNEHGKELMQMIQQDIISEPREISEAVNGNPQLWRPPIRHSGRSNFVKSYLRYGDTERAMKSAGVKKEMAILQIKQTLAWRGLAKIKRTFFVMRHNK